MSVSDAEKLAKAAMCADLVEHPAWREVVEKRMTSLAKAAFVGMMCTDKPPEEHRGMLRAVKAMVEEVYKTAEVEPPSPLKEFFLS